MDDRYTTYDGTVVSLNSGICTVNLPHLGHGRDIKLSILAFLGRIPLPTDCVRIRFKNDEPIDGIVI